MSNLKMVEKARRIIMESGNFTMSIMTLWNNKNKDSFKLDPVTKKEFESKRYQQGSNTVTTLDFRSSDYIAFEYNDWERKANMSVFVSYPNIYNCKQFFQEVINVLSENQVFNNAGELTAEGAEYFIQSEPLAGGKKLGAYFSVINRNDSLVNCVTLVIGSDDCAVDLDLNTFAGLSDLIQSIDLLTQATLLMNMALATMGGGNVQSHSNSTGGFNTSSTPRRQNGLGTNTNNKSGGLGLNRRQSPTLSGGNKKQVKEELPKQPVPEKNNDSMNLLFDINAQMSAGESLEDLDLDCDGDGEIEF